MLLAGFVGPCPELQPLRQFGLVHLEQRRQGAGHHHLLRADQAGVRAYGFDEEAGRQHIAARVENVAAPGGMNNRAFPSPDRFAAQVLMPHDLQIDESVPQPAKSNDQQQSQQRQSAILNRLNHG